MSIKKSFKIPFLIIYALLGVLSLYILVYHEYKYSLKLLPTLMLALSSLQLLKKFDKRIFAFFLSIILGDVIIVNFAKFGLGLYFHSLSFIILSYLSWSFFKKKLRKEIIKYFVIFLILFLIVFFFSIDNKGAAYNSIFIYGVSLSLVTSLLFTNYLKMMIQANYILFLAIAARIVSDSILTIVMFNNYNMYYTFVAYIIYFTSNYLFFRGFTLKYV